MNTSLLLDDMSFATAALLAFGVIGAARLLRAAVKWLAAWNALRRIPAPPAPSLLWGHLPAILSDRAPILLAKWAAERGPLMRLRLITAPMVVLTDPEAAARILRRGPDYLPKSRAMYEAFECGVEPRTPNMLTSEDNALWRAVRGAVAPAFSATSLKQALPRMVQLTERACGIVDAAIDAGSVRVNGSSGVGHGGGVDSSGDAGAGSAEVDVTDLTKRVTSDMMGTLLFGEDLQNIDYKPSEYMRMLPACVEAIHQRLDPLRPLASLWDRRAADEARLLREHDRVIGQKLERIKQCKPAEWTIAAHLLRVVDPRTGAPLDDARLKAELTFLFPSGSETTSYTATWALGLLATHPSTQSALARELAGAGLAPSTDSPAAATPRAFDWADLNKLPYLNAVIKETLRLYSPASLGSSREAVRDVELCGFKVPKGTIVTVPPYVLCLQDRNFADAAAFKPERWLAGPSSPAPPADGGAHGANGADGRSSSPADARRRSPSPSGAGGGLSSPASGPASPGGNSGQPETFAFGLGPRDCVGQQLALMELQVLLAALAGRYEWRWDGAKEGKQLLDQAVYHVTLQPAGGGLRLRAARRAPVAL